MVDRFLVFTLAGPMAAWGDVAVGESRPVYDRPSKSAVLGLMGAALGLARDDEDAHRALREGYGFAVAPTKTGQLLLDYHTAQVPIGKSGRGLPTRREELAQGNLNTTLSTRSYRTDTCAIAVLWSREGARWSISALRDALLRPIYPLFLGRRACPPSLPLHPAVLAADAVPEAINHYVLDWPGTKAWGQIEPRVLFSDVDGPGLSVDRETRVRRDDAIHRGRRTFANRDEVVEPLN